MQGGKDSFLRFSSAVLTIAQKRLIISMDKYFNGLEKEAKPRSAFFASFLEPKKQAGSEATSKCCYLIPEKRS